MSFARGRLAMLRGAVAEHAAREGLAGPFLEDFVLAVNEISANAVLHGGGHGRLRLWSYEGRLWCEITDHGPGLPPGWTGDRPPPAVLDHRGRGLWLTRTLCDDLTIVSGPGGTTVTFAGRVT
ncbi:ATP-binding protein [Nonomuraea sp. K274]|uniref:ATP-binding protein n=1 Tax=Nonomuraea cypriaca TaxID=1187855 RepID=A0A931ADV7_9ACTN|nr:ATP-binding protein [Nonomuraea cypriaca]MBF8188718.1 ATP-binding protein [Nonomuraea cypriaca]